MPTRAARHIGLALAACAACVAACFPDYSTAGGGAGGSIALEQSKSAHFGPAPTASLAFDGDVAAHDAIIVCLNWDGTTVTLGSLTDTLGNHYTQVANTSFSTFHEIIAVAADVRGGHDAVQITLSGAPATLLQVYVHEYSGLAAAAPFDVGSSASGSVMAAGKDDMKSGVAMTTVDRELVFGFGVTTGSATAGTGFRTRETLDQNVTEDLIQPAHGAAQATATAAGGEWSMLMATFRGQ